MRPGRQHVGDAGAFADGVQFLHAVCHIAAFAIAHAGFGIVQVNLAQTDDGFRIVLCGTRFRSRSLVVGTNALLVQVARHGVVVGTSALATVALPREVGEPALVLAAGAFMAFPVGAVGNSFLCTGHDAGASAFIESVVEAHPGIEARFALVVQLQGDAFAAGVVVQDDGAVASFVVKFRVFVDGQSVFGVEAFHHLQRSAVAGSPKQEGARLALDAVSRFRTGVGPQDFARILVGVEQAQATLYGVLRIGCGRCVDAAALSRGKQ